MIWLMTAFLSLMTTNLIFTRALGTSTLLTAAKNRSSLPVLALLMTVFSTLGCMGVYFLNEGLGLSALPERVKKLVQPLLYTVVVCVLYGGALLFLYFCMRRYFSKYKKYIHLSAFNCAVMGALYLSSYDTEGETAFRFLGGSAPLYLDTLKGVFLFGLQAGLGFLLAAVLLSVIQERLYDKEVPMAFRGFPAVMVYLGLLSMAIFSIQAST